MISCSESKGGSGHGGGSTWCSAATRDDQSCVRGGREIGVGKAKAISAVNEMTERPLKESIIVTTACISL
ncbi:hypothetical protein AcV7_009351 [Taiwanofungus camphoratus]|nr:hypothetical protein AcV7_009351 [Antrodia cinnamomea]